MVGVQFLDYLIYRSSHGRLAQLVRAAALHAVGQGFESLVAHFPSLLHRLYRIFYTNQTVFYYRAYQSVLSAKNQLVSRPVFLALKMASTNQFTVSVYFSKGAVF